MPAGPGSKSSILSAKSISSLNFAGNPSTSSVHMNDAPRAGQTWNISSVFYQFTEMSEELHTFGGPPSKARKSSATELTISMALNGIIVAEQIINLPKLQSFKTRAEWENFKPESYPIVGAIEPFGGTILYPGNGLEIFYSLEGLRATGFGVNNYIGTTSGTGTFYVTYNLASSKSH